MTRWHLILVALAMLLASCGAPNVVSQPNPTGTPSTTTNAGSAPVTTDVEPISEPLPPTIPAPGDVDSVLAALERMPAEITGALKVKPAEGQVRYNSGGEDWGVEVIEIEDAYGSGTTVDEAIDLLAIDINDPFDCSNADTWCLLGDTDGFRVVAWGHREGSLMFGAVAPDNATLDELLNAWQGATG